MTRLSNNDINQLKSYTEVVTTGNTALIAVSFDYVYGKDGIVVTIDAKDPTTMGYTVTMPNETTVAFSPPVPTGHTIRLQRETNIDKMEYIFTSGALFIASNMDANFEKIRHAQQDVRDAFNVLRNDFSSVNAATNTAVNAANTALTAANLSYSLLSPFIVGGALSVYTKAQIDALIATGGKSTVFSIASGGTGATTAEEARANLGVPSTSDINAKMDKAANLNDVQDKAAARTNLGVYSKGAVDNVTAQATETTLGTAKIATTAQAQALTDNTTIMTPAKIPSAFNATGEAPLYACRAWVNFNGVEAYGTYFQVGTVVTVTIIAHGMSVGQLVNLSITSGIALSGSYIVDTVIDANTFTYIAATSLTTSGNITRNLFIRASGNVLSVTDNGAGDWTINFAVALPSANYAALLSVGDSIVGIASIKVLTGGSSIMPAVLKTASACRIVFGYSGGGVDSNEVSVGFIV